MYHESIMISIFNDGKSRYNRSSKKCSTHTANYNYPHMCTLLLTNLN